METNSKERLEAQARDKAVDEATMSLGALLKQQRLAQQAELAAVAAAIRVPQHYLQAIEDERYDRLPGKAYAIGFIRCYAKYLGLPQQDMVERYKAEANPCGPVHNLYWQEPARESRLPQRSLVMAGLIAALCVYSVWFSLSGDDVAVAPLPDMVLARAGQAPTETAEVTETAAPAVAEAADTEVAALMTVSPQPGDTQAEPATGAEMPAPRQKPVIAGAVETAVEKSVDTVAAADTANLEQTVADLAPKVLTEQRSRVLMAAQTVDGPQMVTVRVIEEAWLHVTQGEKILFSGVLPAGREYRPPSGEGVELTTGNAGGVILKLDDWASGPLGRSGLVRRNIPLEASVWRSRQALAESF